MQWYSLLEQNIHVLDGQISTKIHQKNLSIKQVGLLNLFQNGRPSLGHEDRHFYCNLSGRLQASEEWAFWVKHI